VGGVTPPKEKSRKGGGATSPEGPSELWNVLLNLKYIKEYSELKIEVEKGLKRIFNLHYPKIAIGKKISDVLLSKKTVGPPPPPSKVRGPNFLVQPPSRYRSARHWDSTFFAGPLCSVLRYSIVLHLKLITLCLYIIVIS
jgi:hypothetical protein